LPSIHVEEALVRGWISQDINIRMAGD
jgi:hypothetical protein